MRRIAGAALALTLALVALSARAESLRDIYELALANDAQLKAEEAQYRANLETERLQRSGLLPQLNANYDYIDTDQTVVLNDKDIAAPRPIPPRRATRSR